ncbi:MAG: hypothetical protein ACREFL_10895 [Stellaceae bacterium]
MRNAAVTRPPASSPLNSEFDAFPFARRAIFFAVANRVHTAASVTPAARIVAAEEPLALDGTA